jgi:deazaflavin-dependent oxidoreductase (nitroreductase family)
MAISPESRDTSVENAVATAPAGKSGRPRQSPLLMWFFRLPVALYRIGLADQLGRSTLLLTTHGRKTGRRRMTPLNFLIEGDVTYVLSGMGPGSDWLRNLQSDPHVQVQIGRRCFDARAEVLVDPVEHRRVLSLWVEQSLRTAPPPVVLSFLRRLGYDYNANVRRHLDENQPPPIVALRPISHRSKV